MDILDDLDPDSRRRLRTLTRPPAIAWPTVALLGACLIALPASYAAGIARAISTNTRFNDWCGRLAATGMSPGTTLGLFFWLPHVPHEVSAAEAPYRATTVRRGFAIRPPLEPPATR